MKKDSDGIWLFESFFVMTRCPMFLKKSFSLNNIGVIIYYIVKPELLGLGMIYRGMVVDIWNCSL